MSKNSQLFKNKRTGKLYYKLGLAIDCTENTAGKGVILYKSVEDDVLFVRETLEFIQLFEPVDPILDH